ncbi:MAG: type II toxin-antitoxin system RelE/ParE family toxin [bacterium]|nr:type II toxin-antitoxin system RelE/ParE family toxin [bacterium]
MDFKIIFYKSTEGSSPIEEFLDDLERVNSLLYAQTLKGLEKLKNRAYHKEPLSMYLELGLWELRIRSENNILRVIYTFTKGQIIILLHGFIKKQQKTPTSELEEARKRLKDLKIRKII